MEEVAKIMQIDVKGQNGALVSILLLISYIHIRENLKRTKIESTPGGGNMPFFH